MVLYEFIFKKQKEGQCTWNLVKRKERQKIHCRDRWGHITDWMVAIAKKLDCILRAIGSHWRVLSSNDIAWFCMKHAYAYSKMESRGRGKNWEMSSETSQKRTCSVLDYSIFGELENSIDLGWPRMHFKGKVNKIYWWIACGSWVKERDKG